MRERAVRLAPWIASIATGLLIFGSFYIVDAWLNDEPAELRVVRAGDALAMLLIDGQARILIVNTADPQQAISALGRLNGPLEGDVTTLLSPADDDVATGLYQTLLQTTPGQVIVLGVPGAEPIWSEIEAECDRRDIVLNYIAGTATIATDRLRIMLEAAEGDAGGASTLTISMGTTSVDVALGRPLAEPRGHLLVSAEPSPGSYAAVVMGGEGRPSDAARVVVPRRGRVRVVFAEHRIRVYGGSLRDPQPQATATTGAD